MLLATLAAYQVFPGKGKPSFDVLKKYGCLCTCLCVFICSTTALYYREINQIYFIYILKHFCAHYNINKTLLVGCIKSEIWQRLKDATYTSNIKNTLPSCGIQIHEMQISISCGAQTMFCIIKSMTPVQTMFSRNFKIQKLFSDLISRDAYISLAYLIQIACCSLKLFSITYEYEASEMFFFCLVLSSRNMPLHVLKNISFLVLLKYCIIWNTVLSEIFETEISYIFLLLFLFKVHTKLNYTRSHFSIFHFTLFYQMWKNSSKISSLHKNELYIYSIQWCEKVLAPFLILYFFACLPHFNVSDHQTNLNINQR